MNDEDLAKKLKIEAVERCVNCQLLVDCNTIGLLEDCACFVEVECDKAMVIVRLKEYSTD